MTKVYGNHLPPEAPAALHVTPERLAELQFQPAPSVSLSAPPESFDTFSQIDALAKKPFSQIIPSGALVLPQLVLDKAKSRFHVRR